jgi:NitT/TauT family transport system substrate-binding protein
MKRVFLILLTVGFCASSVHAAERVRVAYPAIAAGAAPIWITWEKGIWHKHGLDVEVIYLGGGSRALPALLGGSIELFLGSDTASYVAAMQGAKLAKLGVTMNSIGYYLMTQPDIRTLADLKGKVIGIGLGRDLPYIYLSKKLRENNIDPKNDVKLLSLGGGQMGYMTALKTGIVQAAMILPPTSLLAERAGLKPLSKIDAPTLGGGVNTTQAFVEKNREVLIRFLKGFLEGIHFMIRNREESLKIFARNLKNPDPEVNAFLYEDITTRVANDLRPIPESIRSMLDFIALDLPQAQRISEKDFWDLSLLDEIQKSGFVEQLQKR